MWIMNYDYQPRNQESGWLADRGWQSSASWQTSAPGREWTSALIWSDWRLITRGDPTSNLPVWSQQVMACKSVDTYAEIMKCIAWKCTVFIWLILQSKYHGAIGDPLNRNQGTQPMLQARNVVSRAMGISRSSIARRLLCIASSNCAILHSNGDFLRGLALERNAGQCWFTWASSLSILNCIVEQSSRWW